MSLVKLARERNTTQSPAGVLGAGSLWEEAQTFTSLNVKASIHACPKDCVFFMKMHSFKQVNVFQAEN